VIRPKFPISFPLRIQPWPTKTLLRGIAQQIADTMDEMGLKLPPIHVDIAAIRRKFHAAERESKG
jgi:hypothetical protein